MNAAIALRRLGTLALLALLVLLLATAAAATFEMIDPAVAYAQDDDDDDDDDAQAPAPDTDSGAAPSGGVQTGAGGTAADLSDLAVPAGLAALALGATGFAVLSRRRASA